MTPERMRQIEELYHAACENRVALDHADPELRREVESLLAEQSANDRLLHSPAIEVAAVLLQGSTVRGLAPGVQLGPYKIESALGKGGMGEVWKALDTRLNRFVAIKKSDARFSERFTREGRAIAALNHPHICTLYDIGPNYLVMEFVEGETLAARREKRALPADLALRYGAQIAEALAAAHAKGIIHRDLKPSNIMVTKSGIKVLDFGLAKVEGEALTRSNAIMGTPAYMAPEQMEGQAADPRTDIFALGLVLYEMAIGTRALPGGRPQLDSLPEKLAHVVERCIEPNPEDRWQNARDVQSELEWAAKPAVVSGSAEHLKAGASGTPVRVVWLWLAAATLATVAVATLAWVHFRQTAPEARVVRSTILPPEKTSFSFTTNLGPVALSPDGRRMVFAATAEDGKSQLWIRPLDAEEAQLLAGTEGGQFPFWSPDSRWVAFFAGGKLKKIDPQGGPPIDLADAPSPRGGSWSANGTIVFAPTSGVPTTLQKISSAGGAAAVQAVNAAAGSTQRFPWFLPDGEHFLFTAAKFMGGAGRTVLLVGSLGSTAGELIGETDSNVVYAEGRLLYLRGSTLMAQPFDPRALQTAGEAVPVVENVETFLNNATGVFSMSAAGLLAYQTGTGAVGRQLTWFDRTGKPMGTIGEPRQFFHIELSPDGKILAATSVAGGNLDLWTYDLARGLSTRLTFDPAAEVTAVWSADGRTVAFNSNRKGGTDLYRKPSNGSGAEDLLYADDRDKNPTSWSRDGKFLLYHTTGGDQGPDLFVLPLIPERPRAPLKPVPFLQTKFAESWGQFSPDGRWVAYTSNESQQVEVYVAPFSRPTEKHQISTGGGLKPRWRQDGKEIFYQTPGGQLMAAEVRIGAETVEVGAVNALFGGIPGGYFYLYDVSADGQRILAAVPAGSQKGAEPVTLVLNWTAALKK